MPPDPRALSERSQKNYTRNSKKIYVKSTKYSRFCYKKSTIDYSLDTYLCKANGANEWENFEAKYEVGLRARSGIHGPSPYYDRNIICGRNHFESKFNEILKQKEWKNIRKTIG